MSAAPVAAAKPSVQNAAVDMRRALSASPPDFLALVSLVQRAGAPVLRVGAIRTLRTPLHVAAMHGKDGICALLLERGADVEARDSFSCTPLMTAIWRARDSGGCAHSVVRLLIARGAAVDARCDRGSTTLMISAALGTAGMCRMLLDAGVGIDATDRLGETALHKAALRGDGAIARFLVEQSASLGIRACCGSTAAELAVREGSVDHLQVAAYLQSVSSFRTEVAA